MRLQSWKLFSRVILVQDTYDNPVFLRETDHSPIWYSTARWLTIASGLRSALLLAGSLLWILSVFFINNLLMFLLPPLLLMAIVTSLTLAPIVAQERLKQSWDTLLTTPYSAETILLSKLAGAMWWLRSMTMGLGIVLIVIAAGVGVISLVLIPAERLQAGDWLEPALCGLLVLIPAAGSIFFIVDRIQHYLLIISAALAASTASPSLRSALPAATTAVLLIWLAEILLSAVALASHTGYSAFFSLGRLLTLATLGPVVLYIADLGLGAAALFTLLTLLLREAAIGGLWLWIVRRARPTSG